ncbi:MAG: hypothetical protein IPK39_10800 [Sulfuritalea sp.]|nr:hypothetical protein [Sulfuritalea sp.]
MTHQLNEIVAALLALAAIFVPLLLAWAMVEWECRKHPCRFKKKGQ